MKISNFIIALVLVAMVATTFTMTVLDLSGKYGTTYDEDELAVFGNATELHELAEDLEDKTVDQNVESGIIDIVGAYIGRALDALKLSMTSFGVFENMATKAADKLGLPAYFLTGFITIMLVIIIFIIVSAMIKKDV